MKKPTIEMIDDIATQTNDFVSADLHALCREAIMNCLRRNDLQFTDNVTLTAKIRKLEVTTNFASTD